MWLIPKRSGNWHKVRAHWFHHQFVVLWPNLWPNLMTYIWRHHWTLWESGLCLLIAKSHWEDWYHYLKFNIQTERSHSSHLILSKKVNKHISQMSFIPFRLANTQFKIVLSTRPSHKLLNLWDTSQRKSLHQSQGSITLLGKSYEKKKERGSEWGVRKQGVCLGGTGRSGEGWECDGWQEKERAGYLELCLPPLGCHLADPPIIIPGQASPTFPSDHQGRRERRREDPLQKHQPFGYRDST